MRWPRPLDIALTLVLAASYPLYVQLDALPRADAVGPPVPDRYPWMLAAAVAAWLGVRAVTLDGCLYAGALLAAAAIIANTDDARITGVASRPERLAVLAFAAIIAGHVGASIARRVRRGHGD